MNILQTMPVNFINTVQPPLSSLIVFCATTLATLTVIGALAFIFFHKIKESGKFAPIKSLADRIRDFVIVAVSTGGAYIAAMILKNIFKIPRPFISNPNIHALISETGYGFPSGHATTFMALAVALFLINRRAGMIAGAAAILIGLGRIFAGVHSPLDILGGYVLGTLFAYIIYSVYRRINS